MAQIAFRHKKTGKTFMVLSFDKTVEPPQVTLKGDHSTFVEPYDKKRFEALGYELVQIDDQGKAA